MHSLECNRISDLYFCVHAKIYVAMSKGNLFMGNASGKLADVVLYRNAGAQVARLRVRNPKNPRSEQQIIQRVIQSTNSKAYSLLQFICNHSFEGKQSKTDNQSAFMRANVARDRYRVNVSPIGYRPLTSFNSKDVVEPIANNYIIAQGSLPEISFGYDAAGFKQIGVGAGGDSYQAIVDALGLQRGDQITFVVATGDPETAVMTGLKVQRVILEPSSGDMSALFVKDGAINLPNEKNEGNIGTFEFGQEGLSMAVKGGVAASVIASRYSAGKWLRSNATMRSIAHSVKKLGEAIDSWKTAVSSDKYLNQAGS